jgi:hypothetical protein
LEVVLVDVVESYNGALSLLVNLENAHNERSVMFLGNKSYNLKS